MSDDETTQTTQTTQDDQNMGITFSEEESGSSVHHPGLLMNENKIKKAEEVSVSESSDSSESSLENKNDIEPEKGNEDWVYKINGSMTDDSDNDSVASVKSIGSTRSVQGEHNRDGNINHFVANDSSDSDESVQKKRRWYMRKFHELKKKGFQIKHFSDNASLQELKDEYDDLVYEQKKKNGITLEKNVLVTVVSLIEMANTRYDPFKLDLKGWSESFHENIDSMDEVLEELYDKYYDQFMFNQMPVEARLIVTVAFSALSFHFTKAYLTPERMRNIQKAKDDIKPKNEMPAPSSDVEGELLKEWLRKEENKIPSMDELKREEHSSKRTQRFKLSV